MCISLKLSLCVAFELFQVFKCFHISQVKNDPLDNFSTLVVYRWEAEYINSASEKKFFIFFVMVLLC